MFFLYKLTIFLSKSREKNCFFEQLFSGHDKLSKQDVECSELGAKNTSLNTTIPIL